MALRILQVVCLVGLQAAVVAQSAWTQVASAGPARYYHGMAYDGGRGTTVLFGGSNSGAYLNDTWEWDGANWLPATPASNRPSARIWHAMVYDSNRGRVVLFGGYNSNTNYADTWEWDGVTWTQRAVTGPSARCGHAMAFDTLRARAVLFGGGSLGVGSGDPRGDTWEWDGSTWLAVPGAGPSARYFATLAYDTLRGRAVLFGGQGGQIANVRWGDTWEWDGSTWVQSVATGPSPRAMHAMAYDSRRGTTVLFGGEGLGGFLGDTWEWNGASWTQLVTAGPSSRRGTAMAYDTQGMQTVLFGGGDSQGELGETWQFSGPPPTLAAAVAFGQGCPGPAGTPQLSAVTGSRPIIGHTFQMQLTNVPISIFALPVGAVGFSNLTFGGAPLPAPLDAIGAPSCRLFVSIDQEFVLNNQSGSAAWSIPVPFEYSLLGLDAYLQGAVIVPGFNAANLVVANAVHAVVGSF